MISILVVFYLFIFLFAVMGAMRGWAKELLVIFSVILALAFIAMLETLIPVVGPFVTSNPNFQFWMDIIEVVQRSGEPPPPGGCQHALAGQ